MVAGLMRMAKSNLSCLLFFVLFFLSAGASASNSTFELRRNPRCQGSLQVKSFAHKFDCAGSCGASQYDRFYLKVRVYARYGLPQNPGYRVEACMNGKNCATMYSVQELKLCDGNDDYNYGGDGDLDYYSDNYYYCHDCDSPITFQPIDWQSCGEAGNYEVVTSFAFPSGYDLYDRSFSWLSWFESYAYYVDVNAIFTNESEDQDQSEASGDNNSGGNSNYNSGGDSDYNSIYTKCSISFKAVNSSTSSSSSRWQKYEMYCLSILGFAALVGGAIACVHRCKEKEKDSQLEGVGDFIVWEAMKNQSGTMT